MNKIAAEPTSGNLKEPNPVKNSDKVCLSTKTYSKDIG
jgi:hypothetical protein